MDILLDTHALIWFLNGDKFLSNEAKKAIEDSSNIKIVSIASIWEIAIKISLGKFQFKEGLKSFMKLIDENGFEILPITFKHALEVSKLEFIHRDPFDRLLIAQAKSDDLILITKDETIRKYQVKSIW
ncbi:MAG: type II toxin-antitoxin system VapC family toxin [Cytophagaceae bacterium]|nr:type II toxin-antitoxin system VapC family toxin [Cytophagaceae bacterium]MBK9934449.1 type II toxin-antitoxin system VapC family toxin [Cytophagaceae bacterium]MBL0300893.1 type II toxin-antitoxin system VapC family toxin [Cytophagaceae bacterium]